MSTYDYCLTIAIPTWNRAEFLYKNLEQLKVQIQHCSSDVEIVVSDNCSSDDTSDVVEFFLNDGMPIRYLRNTTNIGSDCNIAQCFNVANGKYVLVLGDDDLLIDGSLSLIISLLRNAKYGVLALRAYGFDNDFRKEHPGGALRIKNFTDPSEFIVKLGVYSTLISANIISKEILSDIDANDYCGTSLVQTHLVYEAALKAECNGFVNNYLVACKRNNSGGYSHSKVFVDNLLAILYQYANSGLRKEAIVRLENRLLIGYYPFYLLRQRLRITDDLAVVRERFRQKFAGRVVYLVFVKPIIDLNRPCAIIYGAFAVLTGRVIVGDLRVGLNFAVNKIRRFLESIACIHI